MHANSANQGGHASGDAVEPRDAVIYFIWAVGFALTVLEPMLAESRLCVKAAVWGLGCHFVALSQYWVDLSCSGSLAAYRNCFRSCRTVRACLMGATWHIWASIEPVD